MNTIEVKFKDVLNIFPNRNNWIIKAWSYDVTNMKFKWIPAQYYFEGKNTSVDEVLEKVKLLHNKEEVVKITVQAVGSYLSDMHDQVTVYEWRKNYDF